MPTICPASTSPQRGQRIDLYSHKTPRSEFDIPSGFKPPHVVRESDGVEAFHAYDWYFNWVKNYLKDADKVFLTPCASTKPIHSSNFHKHISQRFYRAHGSERELLVVSEPVVLIRYQDLFDFEDKFCYDFPPKFLGKEARALFVERLRSILTDKDIVGCLPRHHASLINDAVGNDWRNYWDGNIFSMMKKAGTLARQYT